MNLLDKIIYVADYIEPNRDQAPHLDRLRNLAFVSLDKALAMILRDTVDYLQITGKPIDPRTMDAYTYYRNVEEI